MSIDVLALEEKRDPVIRIAEGVEVTNQHSYETAGKVLTGVIAPAIKAIKAGCKETKATTYKAHKAAVAQETALLRPLLAAKKILEDKVTGYLPDVVKPPLKGVSQRKVWTGEVTDIKRLLSAIADGRVSADLIIVDQKKLDALAQASDGLMSIPGVEMVSSRRVSVRASVPDQIAGATAGIRELIEDSQKNPIDSAPQRVDTSKLRRAND